MNGLGSNPHLPERWEPASHRWEQTVLPRPVIMYDRFHEVHRGVEEPGMGSPVAESVPR
jgi:hypothetical protein